MLSDFPEHHEDHQVVGQDESVHGAREAQQHPGELPDARRVLVEVPAAVEENQVRRTPVTIRVSTHRATSMFMERFRPSWGIHSTDSNGTGPSSTCGVMTSACTKAAVGTRAAIAKA